MKNDLQTSITHDIYVATLPLPTSNTLMSHYISSFLIEPVVRQARRFSRPATEESPAFAPQQDTSNGQETIHSREAVSQVGEHSDGVSEESGDGSLTAHVEAALRIPAPQTAVSSEPEPRDLQSSEVEDAGLSQPARTPPTRSRGNTDQSMEDAMSSNPLVGIQDRLSSNNTSLSSSIHEAGQGANRSRGNNVHNGSLPADDGMGVMRKRIIEIQMMNSSNREKSRLIHELMTEQYSSSQTSLAAVSHIRPRSPASMTSCDRPYTPSSGGYSVGDTMHATSPPTSPSSPEADTRDDYQVTPDDLIPTYYSKPNPPLPKGETDISRSRTSSLGPSDEDKHLGCKHYRRNVKLQCSACNRWYTCRFCHDEVEDHSLNRRATKHMLCMLCGCAQPASEECRDCGERGAWYYCNVCKLWDDDPERSIYHCNDCGICRVGQGLGKDFYHCKVILLNERYSNFCTDTGYRRAVCACRYPFETRIDVSKGRLTAIVQFAASICSRPHRLWSSCLVAIAFTISAITNT